MLRRIAHRMLENPFCFQMQQSLFNNYRKLGKAFSAYLHVEGKAFLDIGCSTGECAGQIIDMKSNKYVGVDIKQDYIDLARKRNPDGNFYCHDARKLPFEPKTFDVIMFNGVWHHMSDELIAECLRAGHRLMKDDGVLIVSEPVFRNDWPISKWFLENDRGEFIRDRSGYKALFHGFDVFEEKTLRVGDRKS